MAFSPNKPYRWASGWLSPVYCDNRLVLGFPQWRTQINDGLISMVQEDFPEAAAVAGVATAGIPQASLLAHRLCWPMAYVRSSAKAHGKQNQIEGYLPADDPVVVVEDLLSTAGSSIRAVEALRDAGHRVLGVLAIFTYGFDVAREALDAQGIRWNSLTHWEALMEAAREKGGLDPSHEARLKAWRANPDTWSPEPTLR